MHRSGSDHGFGSSTSNVGAPEAGLVLDLERVDEQLSYPPSPESDGTGGLRASAG